jgi:hypothetical protein
MKILKNILAGLGVIFLIIILLIVAFIVVKPYGIDTIKIISALFTKDSVSTYDHPYLTTQQESILESIGIDTKKVPTEITPALQECATAILGQARVDEIILGSTPTIDEVLKIKSCLE